MIDDIERLNMDYEIAAPGDHRLLWAERSIQTVKNHIISILHGADPNFPADQWDRLLQQAIMTLNMARRSRINPKLSAYMQLWGNFDFNKTLLVPPGCRVIINERPKEQGCWAYHGVA